MDGHQDTPVLQRSNYRARGQGSLDEENERLSENLLDKTFSK